MVTLTIQRSPAEHRAPGRLRAAFATATQGVKGLAAALVRPHKASLRRLGDMPLSVAAAGCVDWAGFHVNNGIGLLITGVSLVVIEHLIADPDSGRPA